MPEKNQSDKQVRWDHAITAGDRFLKRDSNLGDDRGRPNSKRA